MALELGGFKIRVNSISPGLFKSEIIQSLMKKNCSCFCSIFLLVMFNLFGYGII
ncbi:hypothetical protein LINPERPRIM_LOCUS30969, partial [Linum perenne]